MRSRKAETDPEKIIDVFVSDRLEESLPFRTLNDVFSLEGDDTFAADKVASTADIHANNYTDDGKYRSMPKTEQPRSHFVTKMRDVSISASAVGQNRGGGVSGTHSSPSVPVTVKSKPRLCFKCRSDQHLLANCPLRNVRGGERGAPRVNACIPVPVEARNTSAARTAEALQTNLR